MNMPRSFAGLGWVLCLALKMYAADTFNSAYLSEVLADPARGVKDEDGERSGWIELHNGGRAPVNLAGWFLTDTPTNLTRWRFPGVVLLPDKYLLVFASGKDRTQELAHLHAGFRLNPQGGYLALVNRATNVVSEMTPVFSGPSDGVSFGSVRGEPALRGLLPRATPGRANASDGPGFAPEVVFSQPGGNVTNSFTLELSCRATGAVIRFTRDGTLPSSASPVYDAPLQITNTAYIRARAYQPGRLPGPPHSESYLRILTNVLEFSSTLPVLVLDTFGRDLPASASSSFVHLSVFEPLNGRTSLAHPPTLSTRAGFHSRGSSSSGMPQPGFAVKFLDEFNDDKAQALLGLPADSEWVLYAPNSYDPVLIHNPFVHQLSRDLGRYSSRTRFVEVFLARHSGRVRTIDYHGLYVLEEKIKIGKNRVNIDRLDADDLRPPAVTGGYVLKFDRMGPGENGVFNAGDRGMVYVEPREQIITLPQRAAQRRYIQDFISEFERALNGPQWKDPALGYRAYLDVEAAIDFHVLELLSGNVDAMVLSSYFHKPRGGKIVCGPHWDFDRALGSIDERDRDPRVWSTGPFFGGAWWGRLFSDLDLWQIWVDRWQDLRGNHFSLTNMNRLIDQLAGEVRDAQPRQYQRWGLQPRGGSYESEVRLMKDWLSNRVDFIDEQLAPRPLLSQAGGKVAAGFALKLIAPEVSTNATIYYTLDGTDPRAPQGAIASNAVAYARPISIPPGARVMARVRDPNRRQQGGPPVSTPWSGPVTAESGFKKP